MIIMGIYEITELPVFIILFVLYYLLMLLLNYFSVKKSEINEIWEGKSRKKLRTIQKNVFCLMNLLFCKKWSNKLSQEKA